MSLKLTKIGAAVLAAGLLSLAATPARAEPDIAREGEGGRRRELDSMELKPFKADWSTLKDWTNGESPSIAGKPVLIVTWADWYAASGRAVNLAKRLAEKHADDGLIVVAAHDAQGWADAKKPKASKGTLLLAHDADGAFRAALKQDADPDFYVIDRAGQLRYADIATESVEGAVAHVVGETVEEAGGVNDKLAADSKAREIEGRRSAALRERVDLTSLPEVPFEAPAAETYKRPKWPVMPRDPNQPPPQPGQEEVLPTVALPEVGFFPSKPTTTGRAVLLYFWHPLAPQSFQVMPSMDMRQRRYGRDLVVIGVMTPIKDASGQDVKLDEDHAKVEKRIHEFINSRDLQHPLLIDLAGAIMTTVKRDQYSSNNNVTNYVAILSSDGTLRWAGSVSMPAFQAALDRVLAVDPGISARRSAEEEYIKSKGN
jgi:hypothetical protein